LIFNNFQKTPLASLFKNFHTIYLASFCPCLSWRDDRAFYRKFLYLLA
jgi:hypothetical protein